MDLHSLNIPRYFLPCALVLSVPLAFFSGIGNASKHGILLKGGRVIEALANVKAVALDKLVLSHLVNLKYKM